MSPGVLPCVEVPETPAADNGVAPALGAANAFPALPSRPKLGVVPTPVSWAGVVTAVAAKDNASQLPRAGKGKSDSSFAHATITARNSTTPRTLHVYVESTRHFQRLSYVENPDPLHTPTMSRSPCVDCASFEVSGSHDR